MLIAHLPIGYFVTKAILSKVDCTNSEFRFLFWCGIVSSFLPDFDLFYYYKIDNYQHHHHSYWSHIPIYWLGITLFIFMLGKIFRKRIISLITLIVLSNIMSHLFLDSITSKIKWLYPLTDSYFGLFNIMSRYDWWVWNFIFHWTFIIEVLLFLIALYVFLNNTFAEQRLNRLKR